MDHLRREERGVALQKVLGNGVWWWVQEGWGGGRRSWGNIDPARGKEEEEEEEGGGICAPLPEAEEGRGAAKFKRHRKGKGGWESSFARVQVMLSSRKTTFLHCLCSVRRKRRGMLPGRVSPVLLLLLVTKRVFFWGGGGMDGRMFTERCFLNVVSRLLLPPRSFHPRRIQKCRSEKPRWSSNGWATNSAKKREGDEQRQYPTTTFNRQ